MSRFKPGQIIKSTSDPVWQRVQLFEDHVVVLDYLSEHMGPYAKLGRFDEFNVHSSWPDHYVLDESSTVLEMLDLYGV